MFFYRLPTIPTTSTTNKEEYLNVWEAVSKKLDKVLPPGYTVGGFDPGFLIRSQWDKSFTMPVDFALHMIKDVK